MKKNIIFGINPVKSLLKDNKHFIKKIYITYKVKHTKFPNITNYLNIPIIIVSKKWLDNIANNYNHQGIIAVIIINKILSYKDLKLLLLCSTVKSKFNLILIIENVTDPRNLGSALRTAYAVGIKLVIISKYNTVSINNAIVQKTATCIKNIFLIQVSNLLRVIHLLKKYHFWIIGTSPTVNGNYNLFKNKFIYPMAILFGSEDKGLSKLILNNCDKIIYIPMFGNINSLNISVSIGIFLYEIIRQMNYE